ncbi:hypothetical protein ACF8C6_17200 [Pseudomonas sp. zbq_18]|uniref:hypothetical protein n=1 Tax=Pseudomonadota TaxID=1224 RepID=UPI00370B1FDD
MYTARLSLFCAAALLVSGAYANDIADTAKVGGMTAELTVPTHPTVEARNSIAVQPFAELRRQAARAARQDGRWQRIADEDTDTAVRQPQSIDHTPRWVF